MTSLRRPIDETRTAVNRPLLHRVPLRYMAPACLVLLASAFDARVAAGQNVPVSAVAAEPTGAALYQSACAACHGSDGRGVDRSVVGFEEPLPDFTDCRFGNREPDGDWLAVSHRGGPARGFARMMPAFGVALSLEEQRLILLHVRGFCRDAAWPRGELNLPRALVTEKAFPEDELVYTSTVATEGDGEVENEIVYEKRFGPRNQLEVAVPFAWHERSSGNDSSDWDGGLGDLALAFKRVLHHSYQRGSILSVTGEVKLPTGDEQRGFGKGFTLFEPFVTFGQLLPADGFVHLQGGLELPIDENAATEEAFLRAALGRSLNPDPFGRTWSPMVEVLTWRELAGGESVHWDVLPQVQVSLNTRQHVLANLGVRIPLDDTSARSTQVLFYVLWDWFDGGFFEGW